MLDQSHTKLPLPDDEFGRPYVLRERFGKDEKGQSRGWPFSFLILNNGSGVAWKGEQEGIQIVEDTEDFDLFQSL